MVKTKQIISFKKRRFYDNPYSESYTCITDGSILGFISDWVATFGGEIMKVELRDFGKSTITVRWNKHTIHLAYKLGKECREYLDNFDFWEA